MTNDTLVPSSSRALNVAKVLDTHEIGCTVQFLDDRSITPARWSTAIQQRGIAVRSGHLVVVARDAGTDAGLPVFEVIWRGPAVVRVTSVDGDRVTYETVSAPARVSTKTVRDARPEAERQTLRVGQEVVVSPVQDDPSVVLLEDLADDGLPLHPARLRADCVARAQRILRRQQAAGAGAQTDEAGGHDPHELRRLVSEGYDRMAERYAGWTVDAVVDEARPRYLAFLLDGLPPGARVLELGCGAGGSVTQQLAARFAVTGLDISEHQIELARASVPAAEFIHGDMIQADFPAESFDGVAAFYTFLHLPHGDLPGLLRKIGRWLRPDGLLVATLAGKADPGTIEPNWLGVPMYFSGYAPEDARRFLTEAGLQTEVFREETILEDGRPTRFRWVVARRRGAAS